MENFLAHNALLETIEDREFDRPPALVANAHITGLGVARALTAHDVPVIAVDRTGDGAAPPSDAVDIAGGVSYPLDDQIAFRKDIETISNAAGTELVAFGCMDEWVHAFAATEPDGVRLPFANQDVIDAVLNKRSLYTIAERLDIPHPETIQLDSADTEDVVDRLGLPLVIKPARKREFEEAVGTNVIEVKTREQLHEVLQLAETNQIEIVAQRKINAVPGEDHSFASYRSPDGEIYSIVGNATVRNPPEYGTSCLVESTEAPVIERRARAVLNETEYHGISEAEFIYDPNRDEYLLLDINTRPWKWIDLPVTAGANLPVAAYASVTDTKYEAQPTTDTTWVYLPDYLEMLTSTSGTDQLTGSDWQALIDGSFEQQSDLTTGVYRPSDPRPTYQLLQTTLGANEYYCAC